jgi:hypothetical protein
MSMKRQFLLAQSPPQSRDVEVEFGLLRFSLISQYPHACFLVERFYGETMKNTTKKTARRWSDTIPKRRHSDSTTGGGDDNSLGFEATFFSKSDIDQVRTRL